MPEVSSIGAVDYAQQYQQPQYATSNTQVPEEYEAYPAYDPATEQPRSSGGSLMGYAAAAIIPSVITGIVCWKKGGAKANALKELAEARSVEATKKYEEIKKAAEDVVKEANSKEFCWYKPSTWFSADKISIKTIKDKFKNFVDVDAKKVDKDTKKAEEKGKDKAKGADKKD